jgi:hypothetical protein
MTKASATMTHFVVLDADWFVIEKKKCIKKVAYCCYDLGIFGEFSVSLPVGSSEYHKKLYEQAICAHGLDWKEPGSHNDLESGFIDMMCKLGTYELEFFAKGLEKARLLSEYVGAVTDLDLLGCPRFELLCSYEKSTKQKALTFGQWLAHFESPMSYLLLN